MKRFDSILQKTFLFGLPIVIGLAFFAAAYNAGKIDHSMQLFVQFYNLCGFVFVLWMILTLSLVFRLVVSADFRESVLMRITFIRERDEREEMLTGQAAKTTFLLSIAVLLFFLCLSCFQISVYRVPIEKAVNGKTGVLSLGIGFEMFDQQDGSKTGVVKQEDILSYTALPLTNTAVILFLIIWQVMMFNLSMRRLAHSSGD